MASIGLYESRPDRGIYNRSLPATAPAPAPTLQVSPWLVSDGDGLPDAQELLAPFDPFGCAQGTRSAQGTRGTDPHDPASVLRLSKLDKTATGMQMQFPTLTGNPSTLRLRSGHPLRSWQPNLILLCHKTSSRRG